MSSAKILHKLASPALYKSGIYRRLWQQRALKKPFTVVLVYHRVVRDSTPYAGRFNIERGISASIFEAQIRFMLKYFEPVKSSQVLGPSSSRLQFAVTLDDGYEDNFNVAAPILRRLRVPATFFVVSEYVGTDRLFWWEQLANMIRETRVPSLDLNATVPELVCFDESRSLFSLRTDADRDHAYENISAMLRIKPHDLLPRILNLLTDALEVNRREEGRDYGLMNWQQLKELVHQDFEIGNHTATHCNIACANQEMLESEIVSSVATIEQQLDAPILTFAYPYGSFQKSDINVNNAMKSAGCRVAFTTVQGVVDKNLPAFELPRTQLNRRFDFACAFNVQDTLNRG